MSGIGAEHLHPQQPKALTLAEIASRSHHTAAPDATGIDLLGMGDIDTEAFMNELVEIYLHPTNEDGAQQVIEVGVNGVKQPIMRGKHQMIKRKYVEALVSGYSIKYSQHTGVTPDDVRTVPHAAISYPFDVTRDTPRGQAWFRELLKRPI